MFKPLDVSSMALTEIYDWPLLGTMLLFGEAPKSPAGGVIRLFISLVEWNLDGQMVPSLAGSGVSKLIFYVN